MGGGFDKSFWQILYIRVKTFSDTNLGAMAYQKGKVSILASLRNVGLFLSTLIADTQRFSKGSIGGPIMELEKHYGKLNLDVLSVT